MAETYDIESAILLAVRDHLRTTLGYADKVCDVQPDGQPDPESGQLYVAVAPNSWMAVSQPDTSIHEKVDIEIVVSRKQAYSYDRRRNLFLEMNSGINYELVRIQRAMNANYDLIEAITSRMSASEYAPYTTARWVSMDPRPTPRTGDWYGESPDKCTAASRGMRFTMIERVIPV